MKSYPFILIFGSLIGLLVSFLLTIDTFELARNPVADIPCNISPFINCGNAILSEQGEVFGFPNPILGLISFSMLIATGIMLFAGGRAHKLYWQLVNLGSLASVVFILWFAYQSFVNLGTLCIYCLITWAVTWPIFLYTTVWNYRENHLGENSILKFVSKNHTVFLVLFYVALALAIFVKFRDFFLY